ncbi:hypothetical protein GCM10008983_28200 [Lentibacillus halophilus]|uniref:Uncharacterized protein n=1 Tax=Lentibacillus halophilus TaxID=295065 RepID=A0ABN0ZI73_9BACI
MKHKKSIVYAMSAAAVVSVPMVASADDANDIQLTIDDEFFDKAQLEDGFELTMDNAMFNAIQNDDDAWIINQSESENADSEDAVNDKSAEKMDQLNIREINVESGEFEANIEQDSGVYTSELEDANGETKGQEAFDQVYPMVEKLDLTLESSKEETLNQITSTFNLDENDENIEVEISFHNTDDELEFENEKSEDEEADEEDDEEEDENEKAEAEEEDDSDDEDEDEDDEDEEENDDEDEDE